VSNDGWIVTVAAPPLPSDVVARAATGTTAAVSARVADPATSALFVNVDVQFDTVPLGSAEDRFIGETVALVSPGAVPRVDVVSPATVVAPHALATGGGVQRSDVSPSVFLVETVTAPRVGTPVFSLSGDLLGLTLAPEASGRVPVLPAWLLNRAVSEVLGGRALPRSGLGLFGRPAEVVAAGTAGFVVVTAARGSVGERAGIAVGDVIERVDDDPVSVDEPLADLLLPHRPGDRVTLRVRSGDTDRSVDVVLGTAGP
jgi:S1-C subfamily serine protease